MKILPPQWKTLIFKIHFERGGVPLHVKPCETGKEENTVEFSHIPVLLSQCLEGLAIDPAGIYLDGTAGGAGHSKEIAKRLTTGRLISLDQDPDAVATAAARLKGLPAQVVQANFRETARVLKKNSFESNSWVEPMVFTSNLSSRLRSLYTQ